jgi:peptidoglycan/xylan/chitin deacetylase (PgdA/CDA1 family)
VSAATLVLAYPALCAGAGERHRTSPEGPLQVRTFVAHLALMAKRGQRPRSVRELLDTGSPADGDRPLALTFDDGHESHFAAYAELMRIGGAADLFVNPAMVGRRGYLSWAQLRELARHGASVQSRGLRRLPLDGLSSREVDLELAESRRRIEDRLGKAVALFAPPPGRLPRDLPRRARELGYRAVCTVQPALWDDARAALVPRFAVHAGVTDAQLEGWLARSPWSLVGARARALAQEARERMRVRGPWPPAQVAG